MAPDIDEIKSETDSKPTPESLPNDLAQIEHRLNQLLAQKLHIVVDGRKYEIHTLEASQSFRSPHIRVPVIPTQRTGVLNNALFCLLVPMISS